MYRRLGQAKGGHKDPPTPESEAPTLIQYHSLFALQDGKTARGQGVNCRFASLPLNPIVLGPDLLGYLTDKIHQTYGKLLTMF